MTITSQRAWCWFRRNALLIRYLDNWPEVQRAYRRGWSICDFRLRSGVRLSGPPESHLDFLFHEIWIDHTYNPKQYSVRPGDTVIDIGANIGVFATYAASRWPNAMVYAYEPHPGNFEWLMRNVLESQLQNVRAFQMGVTGHAGTSRLVVDSMNGLTHRIGTPSADGEEELFVACTTLGELLETNRIQSCDLLKLDCEGSEYDILRASPPPTLRKVRRIVGEYHHAAEQYERRDELTDLLEQRCFHIDRMISWKNGGLFFARNLGTHA